MKKKQYQTPQMKSVEFKLEQHLLTASNERYGVMGSSYNDSDFDDN